MSQLPLTKPRSDWYHFIGGYYKTPKHFIREAQQSGITRRLPPRIASGMNFGDRVILLRYNKDQVVAFGEMIITKLVLEGEISKKVTEDLKEQNKAEYTPGGGWVRRDCGSYYVIGSWSVDATIPEIVEAAVQAGKELDQKVFIMIGGELTKVYDSPVILCPSPNFTRSFTRIEKGEVFYFEANTKQEIVQIGDYEKRKLSWKSYLSVPPQ